MKKNKIPLVSIIMPVYNAGEFLMEAIESIIRQTYKNFELIIVDDGSIDTSWKIISAYKTRYPKIIKAVRLKKRLNKGGDACANVGFLQAHGKYIARMDADDISHPDRLTKQVTYMQKHPDIMLLGSQARVINRKGKVIGNKHVPIRHEDIYKGYCIFHPVIHPTIMLRRQMLPKRNYLYKIKYSANNDEYTFFEFLRLGKFANLPEALLDYRIHGKNDSLTKPKDRFFNVLNIRIQAIGAGYIPTLKGVMVTLAQTLLITLLPERFIVPIYLYAKGISKISRPTVPKFSFTFALNKVMRYALFLQ